MEGLLDENPKFRALDTAIAKEGFKVILLLRLSPIFPFALSNYLYGVTSVDFFEYMMGTLIGFFPGTLAYVYGGTVGRLVILWWPARSLGCFLCSAERTLPHYCMYVRPFRKYALRFLEPYFHRGDLPACSVVPLLIPLIFFF